MRSGRGCARGGECGGGSRRRATRTAAGLPHSPRGSEERPPPGTAAPLRRRGEVPAALLCAPAGSPRRCGRRGRGAWPQSRAVLSRGGSHRDPGARLDGPPGSFRWGGAGARSGARPPPAGRCPRGIPAQSLLRSGTGNPRVCAGVQAVAQPSGRRRWAGCSPLARPREYLKRSPSVCLKPERALFPSVCKSRGRETGMCSCVQGYGSARGGVSYRLTGF